MTNGSRGQQRITLDRFAFVQIDRDEGGQVFDVSEGGLRFEAFSPQELGRPLYFWFSLDLNQRIEGVAEVAWTDATRKTGGLRFLSLSKKARTQLDAWIDPGSRANGRDAAHGPAITPRPPHPTEPPPKPARLSTFAMPKEPESTPALQPPIAPASDFVLRPTLASLDGTHLVPLERYHSGLRRQLIRGVLTGAVLASVVLGTIVKLAIGHKDVDASRQASEQGVATGSPQPTDALPPLSSSGADLGTSPSADGKAPRLLTSAHSADNPQPTALATRDVQSLTRSSESRTAPVLTRLQQPDAAKNSKRNTATPQQLWSAVQAGDAQAAVALADLYIRGDRVPANCDQARVLLLFASQRRNTEAIKKLQQLNTAPCPASAP